MSTSNPVAGSVVVTAAGAGSNQVLTVSILQDMVFMGITLGAWMWIVSFISVIVIIILNLSKLYKNHIRKYLNRRKVTPTDVVKTRPTSEEKE